MKTNQNKNTAGSLLSGEIKTNNKTTTARDLSLLFPAVSFPRLFFSLFFSPLCRGNGVEGRAAALSPKRLTTAARMLLLFPPPPCSAGLISRFCARSRAGSGAAKKRAPPVTAPILDENGDPMYLIEELCSRRVYQGRVQYKVRKRFFFLK